MIIKRIILEEKKRNNKQKRIKTIISSKKWNKQNEVKKEILKGKE